MHKRELSTILIAVVMSALISTIVNVIFNVHTNHDRISDYYTNVNLAEVSPYILIERVKAGEKLTIVDVRDPSSYAASHISGAINIPASDPDLLSKFQALDPNVPIVTYCYTEDCMASRQVGNILVKHGIFPQHLNVGYAERLEKEGTGDVFGNTKGACPLTGGAGC